MRGDQVGDQTPRADDLHSDNGRRSVEIEQIDRSTQREGEILPCGQDFFGRGAAGEQGAQVHVGALARRASRFGAEEPKRVETESFIERAYERLQGGVFDPAHRPSLACRPGIQRQTALACVSRFFLSLPSRSAILRLTMQLRGLVGSIGFSGDLTPLVPFFRMAEVTHVGKGTSYGLGRLRVDLGLKERSTRQARRPEAAPSPSRRAPCAP